MNGIGGKILLSRRQSQGGDAVSDAPPVEGDQPLVGQKGSCGDGQSQIFSLMAARKRKLKIVNHAIPDLNTEHRILSSIRALPNENVFVEPEHRGMSLLRDALDNLAGRGVAWLAADQGTSGFDDPGLFPGDGGGCAAENAGVLQINHGDDGDHGGDDIGGIQTSSQTGFHDRNINLFLLECQKRHQRDGLKEGGEEPGAFHQQLVNQRAKPFRQSVKPGGTDVRPVDGNAFGHFHDVGGKKPSGPQALASQETVQHEGRGSLALGPGDVYHREIEVRHGQFFGEGVHAPQIKCLSLEGRRTFLLVVGKCGQKSQGPLQKRVGVPGRAC